MSPLAPLIKYGYVILFPLAIIEGPVLTLFCGFLVTLGYFNPWIVYAIMLVGDSVGDTLQYVLGRAGGPLVFKYIAPYFGATPEKIEKSKEYFHSRRNRAIFFSKLIHGIGSAGLMAAGSLHIPYKKYIGICFVISLFQSAVLLSIGILAGHTYLQLARYLDYFGAGTLTLGLGVLVYLGIKKFKPVKSS